MNIAQHFFDNALAIFRQYKTMGNEALSRLNDDECHWRPHEDSNNMATIVRHMHGNMLSRWTDFLTSDGEKEWRERDEEFIDHKETQAELLKKWEAGWHTLFNALNPLKPEDMDHKIYIRKQPHTVLEAITRQIAHYSYHIGQMIYLAKYIKGSEWESLSIPKGKSEEFNQKLMK